MAFSLSSKYLPTFLPFLSLRQNSLRTYPASIALKKTCRRCFAPAKGGFDIFVEFENVEIARVRVHVSSPFQTDFRQDIELQLRDTLGSPKQGLSRPRTIIIPRLRTPGSFAGRARPAQTSAMTRQSLYYARSSKVIQQIFRPGKS